MTSVCAAFALCLYCICRPHVSLCCGLYFDSCSFRDQSPSFVQGFKCDVTVLECYSDCRLGVDFSKRSIYYLYLCRRLQFLFDFNKTHFCPQSAAQFTPLYSPCEIKLCVSDKGNFPEISVGDNMIREPSNWTFIPV